MSKQKPCTNCIHFTRIVDATFMPPIRKPFCRNTKTDITEDQWNNVYDLSGFTRLSFFASPIIQPHKPCDYYLHDDRPEKCATPTTKNNEKCAKDEQ